MLTPFSHMDRRRFMKGLTVLSLVQMGGFKTAVAQGWQGMTLGQKRLYLAELQRRAEHRSAQQMKNPEAWLRERVQNYRRALSRRTNGAPLKTGKISLKMGEVVENRSMVPLSVSVEGTARDVMAVFLFTPFNWHPEAGQFYFSYNSVPVCITTRVRVLQTQHCIAVAKMRNGDYYQAKKMVRVAVCSGLGD